MILITGATGTNGRELAHLLAARGVAARAMVRDPGKAADLAALDGIDVVAGDFDDAASLAAALEGVERAFLVTPSSARAEAQQLGFIAAAKAAGVQQVVKLSQFAADASSPVRFLRYHAAVESVLRDSGMAWTFLRPNLFMQGLLGFAGMIRDQGMLAAPIGEERVSLVDVRDIAATAAAALTGDGHAGKTYTLTGPEALTHAEVAAQIAAATGRPVRFVPISPEQMRAALGGMGMDPWQADGLIEDYAHYARGEARAIDNGVQAATGSAPRSFAAFAHDNAGAFGKE